MASEKSGAIEVGFQLLDVLAEAASGVSLGTAAERVGAPPATAHRIFQSWAALGYVRQDQATRAYELGPGLIRVGAAAGRTFGSWARRHLTQLAQRTGETATLSVLDGSQVSVVAFAQPGQGLQVRMRLGRHSPAHACADGKVLLSQLSDEQLQEAWQDRPPNRLTEDTVVDPEILRKQFEQIRNIGYAREEGEMEPGATGLSVPVSMRWPTAVMLSGPTTRIDADRVGELLPLLRSTARELSEARRRREAGTRSTTHAANARSGPLPPAS